MTGCDFCIGINVARWSYPIRPDDEGDTVWTACAACAELIEADDRDGLAVHSARAFCDHYDYTEPKERLMFASASLERHAEFFELRDGERVRLR